MKRANSIAKTGHRMKNESGHYRCIEELNVYLYIGKGYLRRSAIK
jgi:hypothetical protein